MSNDVSWLPVIGIAVRHFVSVFTGAPGPAHGAATATVAVASKINPKNAHTSAWERCIRKFDSVDMSFFSNTKSLRFIKNSSVFLQVSDRAETRPRRPVGRYP